MRSSSIIWVGPKSNYKCPYKGKARDIGERGEKDTVEEEVI